MAHDERLSQYQKSVYHEFYSVDLKKISFEEEQ